jgi:hypothetical protein
MYTENFGEGECVHRMCACVRAYMRTCVCVCVGVGVGVWGSVIAKV